MKQARLNTKQAGLNPEPSGYLLTHADMIISRVRLERILVASFLSAISGVMLLSGCAGMRDSGLAQSPVILGAEAAQPYIAVCKQIPEQIRTAFELHESLRADDQYEQVIAMPDKEVLVIVSGLGVAGLVVFDAETRRIKAVFSWSDYISHEGVSTYAIDRAYYRLERDGAQWALVAEIHAITERANGEHYLWQFHYGPRSSGSSLRYKLKES